MAKTKASARARAAQSTATVNPDPIVPESTLLAAEYSPQETKETLKKAGFRSKGGSRTLVSRAMSGFSFKKDGKYFTLKPTMSAKEWDSVTLVGYVASLSWPKMRPVVETGYWELKGRGVSRERMVVRPRHICVEVNPYFRQGKMGVWVETLGFGYAMLHPDPRYHDHWMSFLGKWKPYKRPAPVFRDFSSRDPRPGWWPSDRDAELAKIRKLIAQEEKQAKIDQDEESAEPEDENEDEEGEEGEEGEAGEDGDSEVEQGDEDGEVGWKNADGGVEAEADEDAQDEDYEGESASEGDDDDEEMDEDGEEMDDDDEEMDEDVEGGGDNVVQEVQKGHGHGQVGDNGKKESEPSGGRKQVNGKRQDVAERAGRIEEKKSAGSPTIGNSAQGSSSSSRNVAGRGVENRGAASSSITRPSTKDGSLPSATNAPPKILQPMDVDVPAPSAPAQSRPSVPASKPSVAAVSKSGGNPDRSAVPNVSTTHQPSAPIARSLKDRSIETPVAAPAEVLVVPTVVATTIAPAVAPTIAPAVARAISPAVTPTIAPAVAPTITPAVAPAVAPVVAPAVAPAVAPIGPPSPVGNEAVQPTPDPSVPKKRRAVDSPEGAGRPSPAHAPAPRSDFDPAVVLDLMPDFSLSSFEATSIKPTDNLREESENVGRVVAHNPNHLFWTSDEAPRVSRELYRDEAPWVLWNTLPALGAAHQFLMAGLDDSILQRMKMDLLLQLYATAAFHSEATRGPLQKRLVARVAMLARDGRLQPPHLEMWVKIQRLLRDWKASVEASPVECPLPNFASCF
ncbi:hypothetical protein FS749_014475 [Ceratobasidium sp. UAMH 11750]|nr:hypothetical protein FS749_014475 [Ceratobasidium sp. UAMH 11750]